MRNIFKFFRNASNKELEDLFGSYDLDVIFNKFSEEYIIKKIIEYITDLE